MRQNHQKISISNKENIKLNTIESKINKQSKSKDNQQLKTSPRRQRKTLSCNTKSWNEFFEAMHSMHEDQKKMRLQSVPQLRYQNIQKIMESNLQYIKLQRKLQQQAPQIDLDKNNLNKIVSNMNNKGIVLTTTTLKNIDHSVISSQNRRFKSMESILNTIASRENGQDQRNQNTNCSFSPENNRFNSPTLLLQINQIQKNANNSIDQQQDLNNKNKHKINNIPQSLLDIQSVNQSVIINSANTANNINQSQVQSQPQFIVSQDLSNKNEKNKIFNNSNCYNLELHNKHLMTDNFQQNNQKNTLNKIKNQKYQIFQQIKLQNTFENEQSSLRLRIANQNKSNSLASLTSFQQAVQFQEDNAFNSTINQQQLNQSKQTESFQQNNDTITSTNTQQPIQSFRNQSKLNLRRKYHPISKPYQSSQQEVIGNIIQKMEIQKKLQEKPKENLQFIKTIQKMDCNESPINVQQIHAISAIQFTNSESSPQIQQFTDQVDYNFSNSSPTSIIAMQKYAQIIAEEHDQKIINLKEFPSEFNKEQISSNPNTIKISQDQVKEPQQEGQRIQFNRKIRRSNTQQNMINTQKRCSKISINQLFEQSHDFDTSLAINSRRNQQFQDNFKQYQVTTEKFMKPSQRDDSTKMTWQNRKRSLNTFSDMIFNSSQQIQQASQLQFQQQNQTSSRFNYLDVKAETESIKLSLQLKKQKNLQSASINKRKEFIDKIVNSKGNFHIPLPNYQNSIAIQTLKEDEVKNMDKNVITKLKKLFQNQKPSTTDSPSRSPKKMCSPQNMLFYKESIIDFDQIYNKQDTIKNINTSLREQTEENETIQQTKQIKPLAAKSQSFSNRFSYQQQFNQTNNFNPSERFQNQVDMIDQKQRNLSKLLHKKVITETCIPSQRVNRNGISLTCRSHAHTIKNKQIPQIENNLNQKYQLFNGMSSLQIIPQDFHLNTEFSIQLQKPQSQVSLTFNNQNETDIIQIENLVLSNQ